MGSGFTLCAFGHLVLVMMWFLTEMKFVKLNISHSNIGPLVAPLFSSLIHVTIPINPVIISGGTREGMKLGSMENLFKIEISKYAQAKVL
jgi:hypothetical protein